MKRALFLIFIGLINYFAHGQNQIDMTINLIESGRNFTFDYSRMIKDKHEIGSGIRININRITQQDDQSNFYYRRLYASEFYQYFGIHAFYHLYFFNKLPHLKPFIFYDFQITKSTTRSNLFVPATVDTSGNILYRNFIEYFGPFVWIDQNLGIGFKINVYKSVSIIEKFGLGFTWIIGEDKHILYKNKYFETELGYLISVGISVSLNKL